MSDMIQIKVDDKEVMAALERLSKKCQDMRPAMRKISGIMLDAVEENFEKEGRPRWPALSPSTIKAKEKRGLLGKILQSGNQAGLVDSITPRSGRNYAIVGTNKKYAAIHQFGIGRRSSLKSKRIMPAIPARPFLKLTDGDIAEVVEAIERYLKI